MEQQARDKEANQGETAASHIKKDPPATKATANLRQQHYRNQDDLRLRNTEGDATRLYQLFPKYRAEPSKRRN